MEGKTVILNVLILFLLMAQIQVEARTCCRSRRGRTNFNRCRRFLPPRACARLNRCRIVSRTSCPPRYPFVALNSGDDVNEYCNLGCASSVCGALTTMENSDASEIVNEALEKCTKACSTLCAKGFETAPDDQIAPDQIALDQNALDQIALDQIA